METKMTYISTHYKLLKPFLKIASNFPDVNDNRAAKNEQWIFTTHPLDWKQEFPKLTIEAKSLVPKWLGGGQEDGEYYTYSLQYDIVYSYYVKRMKEYVCPDNILRKGKGLVEYMILNNFLPIFNRSRFQIIRENCWIDMIEPKGIGEILPALDEYAWRCDFTFQVTARLNTAIPISGDGYIEQININENVEG
jgi:hypothetical protein